MTQPTIFAVSTAPGRAAIAVIRLSGPRAMATVAALCGRLPAPRRAALRALRDAEGALIDEGVVIVFPAPASQTGEDMAELQVHGGRAVVQALLDQLARAPGCRPAEPGEFVARAFANGRLDLAEVEGLADLIDAETQVQRQQAIAQATGVSSRRYEVWRARLLEAMGLVEAAIDFADEGDVAEQATGMAARIVVSLRDTIAAHLDDGHRGEIAREGYRVVLAGAPNVGKSSLLNALARRPAAIVSPEAGTTRDVIEVRLDLAGHAVIVSDTAGLRETASSVEREGVARTLAAVRAADLVLWLTPVTRGPGDGLTAPPVAAGTIVPVATKADLLTADELIHVKQSSLAISAQDGTGLDALTAEIATRAARAVGNAADPAITRPRHRAALAAALAHLDAFSADPTGAPELRAQDLRLAANALGRLLGKIDADEVLGEIFARFCIGK